MNHPLRQVFLLGGLCLGLCQLADARPKVIEESQWLEAPQPGLTFFAQSVAIDGDWALATALFSEDGSYNYPYRQLALLYRRSGDQWQFDRVLVDDDTDELTWNDPKVAMKNGIAAVSVSPLRAFRRNGATWTPTAQPFSNSPGDPAWANGVTRIDGNTLASIAGRCNYGAVTSDFDGDSWTAPQAVSGTVRPCSVANYASAIDVDGNRLVVTNPQDDYEYPPTETQIYRRAGPGAPWQLEDRISAGDWGFGVALRGSELFVGGWHPLGPDIFTRVDGVWNHTGHLPVLDGYGQYYDGPAHIGKSAEFLLTSASRGDSNPSGIAVYRRGATGSYEQVALLRASNGDALGPVAEISGRTVIVSAQAQDSFDHGRLYFFELPADLSAPELLQDDFEGGGGTWTKVAGQFTPTAREFSRVFHQSSLTGSGVALLAGSDWTHQSVQADIRPTAFSGADRWFGLATRYADSGNHYYVTLRSSGTLQLRRMRNGVFQTLDSASLNVNANQNYRVRLESVGSRHRVYVDGVLKLDAFDSTLTRGQAALLTYRTAADFDNVLVTPNARTLIYDNDLDGAHCSVFTLETGLQESGTPAWDCENYLGGYLRQASAAGIARAALGPVTGEQIVESRLTPEDFAAGGTQDKWLGVMTRYTDASNYYYLVLRSSNRVSLRKLVDGQITELATASFTVAEGGWHTLRLEAIGDRLRGFVDGVQLLEAEDAAHPTGISGIATYRTVGRFDYLRVTQP